MPDIDAPSRRHQLGLAAALGGGVALLTAIVAGLGADERWPIDEQVRSALATRRHPKIRSTLRVAGLAGTSVAYIPVGVMVASVIRHKHDMQLTLPVIATIGGAALGALALKHLVRRPRPVSATGRANLKPSFPSGHATRATAMTLVCGYLLVRERMLPAEFAMPLALGIALSAGISRAYADAHWTTDVVGGWALGAASAAGGALWYEHLRAESHDDD